MLQTKKRKSIIMDRKTYKSLFQDMEDLARSIIGNGLTEIPATSVNLIHRGTQFAEAILDLTRYGAQLEKEDELRKVQETAFSRRIQESKEDWDAHLANSPKDIQEAARTADGKIQTNYKYYTRLLEDLA